MTSDPTRAAREAVRGTIPGLIPLPQLVWTRIGGALEVAETRFGRYIIESGTSRNSNWPSLRIEPGGREIARLLNVHEGKVMAEADYQNRERRALADALEAALAENKRLTAYGPPEFYVTAKHQSEAAVRATQAENGNLRDKLADALRRTNAAEARASAEQKKREAAEAEREEIGRLAMAAERPRMEGRDGND